MFKCTIISAGKVSKTYNSMLWIYPKLMIKILQYCNPCFLPGLGIFSLSLCSFAQNRSFYRATMSNLLVIRGNSSQKTINSLDKFAFLVCLWQFSLFFNAQKWIAPIAHLPFFKEWFERFAHSHSLKRVTVSNSFRSIMTKEQLLAIRSGCLGRSWQKSNGSDSLFFLSELLFRSQKTSKFPTLLSTLLRKYFAICSVLYVYYYMFTFFLLNLSEKF